MPTDSSDSPKDSSASSSGESTQRRGDKCGGGGWSSRPPKKPWKKPQWLIHWPRTLLILFGLIGVLVALLLGYRQLKKRQIRRLDEQALTYLQQGKMQEAQMSLQTALRLNPSDSVALRLQTRLQQSQGKELAGLQAYQELARSGKMTIGDLPPFAMLAERQGNTKLADRLAEGAAKSSPTLGHLIRAELLKQRKQPAEAAAELRLAIKESEVPFPAKTAEAQTKNVAKDAPKNSNTTNASNATNASKGPAMDPKAVAKMRMEMGNSARMALVDLLLKQGGAIYPGDSAKAAVELLSLLKELAGRENEVSLQALATGLRAGVIPPAERGEWIERLRSHPKVTPELLLLSDVAAIQRDSTDKGAVVSSMIERAKKQASGQTPEQVSKQRLAAAQVLLEMKELARVEELISRDEAMKSPAAFLIWMQAKVLAANHGEVIKALELPANPLPPHLRDLYLAAELKADHQDAKADAAFQRALADHVIHGKKGPEQVETLIFLSAAGEQNLFEQGLKALLADPADAETSLHAVVAGVEHQQDSAKQLRILELASVAPTFSGNVRVANELAYLRLVMGQPVEMRDLVARREANPNEFAFRVTESLALVQAGKNARALEVLESIEADVDASKLPSRQLAMLAMAMALNGDREKAKMLLSHVRPDQLSRQEISLIQQKVPNENAPSPASSPAAAMEPVVPAESAMPAMSAAPIPPAEKNSGGKITNDIPLS